MFLLVQSVFVGHPLEFSEFSIRSPRVFSRTRWRSAVMSERWRGSCSNSNDWSMTRCHGRAVLSHCTGRYGWSPKNGWMAWMMMDDDGWDELNGLICCVWGGKQSPKISKDPTKKINTYRWNMMKLIPKDGKSTEMGLVSSFFWPLTAAQQGVGLGPTLDCKSCYLTDLWIFMGL